MNNRLSGFPYSAATIFWTLPLCLLLICGTASVAAAHQPESRPKQDQTKEVDDQLIDDLGADLLDDLDKLPDITEIPKEKTSQAPQKNEEDTELKRRLGEDLGLENEQDPLTQIGNRMRTIEQRLARQNDPSKQTQDLQQKVVDDLAKLIEEIKKRKQNQSSSSSSGKSQRSKVNQPRQAKTSDSNSNRPSKNSSERVGQSKAQQVDMAQMQALLKDLWGHLPERTREQMMQNSVDQFLPKYEVLLEKYFRRLADKSQQDIDN